MLLDLSKVNIHQIAKRTNMHAATAYRKYRKNSQFHKDLDIVLFLLEEARKNGSNLNDLVCFLSK